MADEAAVRDPKAFQRLEERLQAEKKWPELVAAYQSRAFAFDDKDQRERLLFQAGQIAQEKLGDGAAASGHFRQAFDVRKTCFRALPPLRAIATARKDWKTVSETLELELAAPADNAKKARLSKELGDALCLQEERDPEEAVKAYGRALELDPKQRSSLVELEKVCKKHAKWKPLVAAYKKLADATQGKDAAVFHFLAAGILDERLKTPDSAERAYRSAYEAGPADPRILGAIALFFEKRNDFETVLSALETALPLTEGPAEKAKLLRRMGSVCEKNAARPEDAVHYYNRALATKPDDAETIARLRAIAETAGDDAGVATALELEVTNLELSPDAKADRLEKAAERREKAQDFERALADLSTLLDLKPRSPRALKAFERITKRLGRWPEHARALELQAALLDPSRSAEERNAVLGIQRRLAEVREKHLGDPKAALDAIARALAIDPEDASALARGEELARSLQDWPLLAQMLERKLEKAARADAPDPVVHPSVIARELARVREEQLHDAKGAAAAWERALQLDPAIGEEALPALRRLYEAAGDQDGLRRTLRWLVDAAHDRPVQVRASLLIDLAHVELERGNARAAAEACRDALALDSTGEPAMQARRVVTDADRELGDVEARRASLTELAARDPEPEIARGARIELAQLEEAQGDTIAALEVLEEQLAVLPADPEALPHAGRLLAALGRPLDAAERLSIASRSVEADDPARAAAFARDEATIVEAEVARLQASPDQGASEREKLEARARAAWARALELDPDHAQTIERYAALCRRTGDSAGLDEALSRTAARTKEPQARARVNKERAALAKGPLARPEEAANLYRKVLKDSPVDPEATAGLIELYRTLERWRDLADLLEATAARDVAVAPGRLTDKLSLSKLSAERPEEPRVPGLPDAHEALREAASVAAGKLGDEERAVACLERLADRDPDDDAALASLATHLAKLGRTRDLERVLDRRAALARTPEERASLLLERGKILASALQDPAVAAAAFEQCLEARPDDREALEGLASAREALGDARAAAETLAKAALAAEKAGDGEASARLELKRGEIARARRDLAEAEAAYRSAIARDAGLSQAHDLLIEVIAQKAEWDALDRVLEGAAEATSDPPRKAALLIRRSDVLSQKLDKADDALAALEKAERATPDSAPVLEARARVQRKLGREADLAATLSARRALIEAGKEGAALPPAEHVLLLREEAHLRGFSLDDLAEARVLLDEARELAPEDKDVVNDLLRVERRALSPLLTQGTTPGEKTAKDERTGIAAPPNPARLRELLERAAALEQDPKRKVDLLIEAGRTAKVRKGDPEAAAGLFREALAVDSSRLEPLRWLQAIAREAHDEESLAEWLEREAEVETDPKRRATVLWRLGDCERRRGNTDRARERYEAALADDPDHAPTLRHIAPLLRRSQEWLRLASVLERLARLEIDKHARCERLVMLGEVRLRFLDDAKGAREAFDEVLGLEPSDILALRGRTRTLDPVREAKDLVDTLAKELSLTPSAALRADLHKRIGTLRHDALEDLEGAARSFGAAIRIRPDDEEARNALRRVYMAAGDWSKLAKSYEDEARRSGDRRLKEERFRQAALLRQHHLNDIEKAISLYKEVLALGDPECLAIEVLPRLLQGKEHEQDRLLVLERIPEIVPGSREAEEALLELGRLREEAGDRSGAQVIYERLLERAPGHAKGLNALISLHRSANDLPRLADALARKQKTLRGGASAACRVERGKVLEDLHDIEGAAVEYEAAAVDMAGSPVLRPSQTTRRFEVLGDAISRLRSIYSRRERWADLARALQLAVERQGDDAEATRILLEKAEVEHVRLKDPRRALESLTQAKARCPGAEAALALATAEKMATVLDGEDLPDELAQTLEWKAKLVPAGAARARVLATLAQVYDARLGRADAATEAWDRCLGEAPDDREALAKLQELCARTKNKRGRARALEREMDLVLAPAASGSAPQSIDLERLSALSLEAAAIHEELEDVPAAIRALERALDRDPGSRRVFEELARLHGSRGHDATLYDLLRRRARASSDRKEQAQLYRSMAILAESLGNDEGAIADWREVLARKPRARNVMVALFRLHAAREEWPEAVEILEREISAVSSKKVDAPDESQILPLPSLDLLRQWAQKQGTKETAGTSDEAPHTELSELHLRAAEIYDKRLQKREEAAQHYASAHARAPRDARPLRGLERIHVQDESFEAVSRVRASLRDLEDDPQKRSSLAIGIASAEEKLGRRAEAIAALRGALEDMPDNAVALALLRGHLLEMERWEEAAAVLSREADVAREASTQAARRLERAKLVRDRLSDAEGATAELERVRALDPANQEALSALADLYAAAGDREKLAKVLDDLARVEEDAAKAADLLVRSGKVLIEPSQGKPTADPEPKKKGKKAKAAPATVPAPATAPVPEALAGAAAAFERALLRVPTRTDVLDSLIEIYQQLGRSKDLAQALHRRAELAASPAESAACTRRAALVEETKLEDPGRAARTLEQLVHQAGPNPDWDLDGALAELARLRGLLSEHAGRELALKLRTSLAKTPGDRKTLLLERARSLEQLLGRPAAAAECLQEALEVFPADPGLADELARLRELAQDHPGVVRALDHALSLAEKLHAGKARTERLASLHRKRADLCAGAAYDPERAFASLRALLAIDPEDDAARESLETILAREGRSKELAEHLLAEVARRRAKGVPKQELAGLERRRAELHRGPLADPKGAEEAYRSALAFDPDDGPAREGLEALLRTQGLEESLAALLAENASRAKNDVAAAEALREEAQVHEQRGDRAKAIARLETALARVKDDRRTLRALVRLYRVEKRGEDLARVLADLVRALGTAKPQERSPVLLERGIVLAELGRAKEAEEALDEALVLDPKNVPAARALAPLLLARGAFEGLAHVYDVEAQAGVDRPRRVWLRGEIGRIRRERLDDDDGAARAFQEALALDAGSLVALKGLASVLRARERWKELVTPLERLAEVAPSAEDKLAATRELAHVLEEKLEDPQGGAERYRQVLAKDERDKDAVLGLTRSLRASVARAGAKGSAPPIALREQLADALERELALETQPDRRFASLQELASVNEALAEDGASASKAKRLEATERAAKGALALKPQDADALATYARVAEKLGKWKELCEATEALAGRVDDKQRAAWMLRRVGKLRAQKLGDAQGAVQAYEAATRADPRDREALEALEPLARELGDGERLALALKGQLALAPDDAKRAVVALRLGEAYEAAGEGPRAIEAFVLAREKGKAPQKKDAQKALDRCYRAASRWTDLARILEARARSEPENATAIFLERAQVLEEKLARFDKAAEALREALALSPDDANAARSLERVLTRIERWDELADFHEKDAARRGPRGYDVLVKLGKLYRDRLDDGERAAAALQQACALNPTGLEAIEALRDLYTKIERWPDLLEVLRLEIGLVKEPKGREQRLLRAARVAEEKLGDLAQAARFYQDASALSPGDRTTLASLARVLEARGDEEALVRTLERDLSLTRDPLEGARIRKKIGLVHAKRLFRRADAIQAYRDALTIDRDDDEALAALGELYRESGAWVELVQVLERRAALARGREGLPIRLELARVLSEKLGKSEDALRMAAAARQVDPRSPEATEIEVEVLRGLGRTEELAEALSRLAASKQDPRERAAVLVELAKHQESLGRPDRALRALEEALSLDPANEPATETALALQEVLGRWDDLLATCERAWKAASAQPRRAALKAKAASVLEAQKKDLARADRLYREALQDEKAHLPAIAGLARVLAASGHAEKGGDPQRSRELALLEEARANLEADPTEKARALARAGDVHREALDDLATAASRYEEALLHRPDLLPALAPLSEIRFGHDDFEGASILLERVAVSPELGQDPERAAELLHALGVAREKKGDREGAAAAYRGALEHKKGHAQALEDLAQLLLEDGAFAAATPVLEELVSRTRAPGARAVHELSLGKALAKTNPDRAAELFKRGLEQVPEDEGAREVYAELLGTRNDPAGSRSQWEILGASVDSARAARARFALADLCEGPLRDNDTAILHLAAAAEIEGDHQAKAARRLAELYARLERWTEAAQLLARAIELEVVPKEKADLYAKLARLFRDRLKNTDLARKCFEKSLELVPTDRHTLESTGRLLETAGDFERLEQIYARAADAARDEKLGDEPALRAKRAEVMWKKLKRPKPAAKEYEAVLALEPSHAGARSALAQVYAELADTAGVERIHRGFLREDPLVLDHYRALVQAWREAGKKDAHAQGAQVLAVLQAATEDEKVAIRAAQSKESPARRGIKVDDWVRLASPDARGSVHDLVTGLADSFEKSIPEDLKSYGLGMLKRSLALDGDSFPEHRLVKRVADLVGIREDEVDLYWMADWKRPEAILARGRKSPALILCPAVFSGLAEAEKAFVLARALALVPARLEPVRAIPARELEKLVLSAAKALDPASNLRFSGEDDKEARAFVARVVKELTPDLQKRLAPAISDIVRRKDKLNVEGFRKAALLTASRAGVLAAGGAQAAASAVVKTNVALRGKLPPTTQEIVRELQEVGEVKDILEFSVSQAYLALRKELGISKE